MVFPSSLYCTLKPVWLLPVFESFPEYFRRYSCSLLTSRGFLSMASFQDRLIKQTNKPENRQILSGAFPAYNVQHPLFLCLKNTEPFPCLWSSGLFPFPMSHQRLSQDSIAPAPRSISVLGCDCGRIIFWDAIWGAFSEFLFLFVFHSWELCTHRPGEGCYSRKAKKMIFQTSEACNVRH